MNNPVKVVVLGGSGVATPELARAVAEIPARKTAVDLVLVGRSADKLRAVTNAARLLVDHPCVTGRRDHRSGRARHRLLAGDDPLLRVSGTTDTEAALDGADYVLNQVRVGGLEARVFDETFPIELGIPGEETVGPGGFSNACRTIPVVLEYCRAVERICPRALVLSFANPASLVQYAVNRYTALETVGLCDGPVSLSENIAAALGVPVKELQIDYQGMHHFGWVTGIWHHGENLLPQALERMETIAPELAPQIARALGAVPGNYFNYYFHPERMLAKKQGKRPRASELLDLQAEILADYEHLQPGAQPKSLEKRKARWYQVIIAPVLIDLIETRADDGYQGGTYFLNVKNRDCMGWLPEDAVVEVPCRIAQGKVEALPAPTPPPAVRQMVQANCAYEQMAVEAIVEADRDKALVALLMNHYIRTYDQAAAVLERVWGQAR